MTEIKALLTLQCVLLGRNPYTEETSVVHYIVAIPCRTDLEVTEFAEHIQDNDYLIVKLIAPIEEYLQDVVEDYRQDVCYEIYSALEKEYEYLTSHEAIREWADELEFLENGEIF